MEDRHKPLGASGQIQEEEITPQSFGLTDGLADWKEPVRNECHPVVVAHDQILSSLFLKGS